jgi:hypothetical protein
MALKAGRAGSVSNFSDSMAEAMDLAFQSEWDAVKDIPLGEAGEEDRKILFSAIAQGVIKHLQQHINDALQIEVRVTQTNEVLMKSDNPAAIPVSGGGSIAAGQADVEQSNSSGNLIVAEGEATNVELLTE